MLLTCSSISAGLRERKVRGPPGERLNRHRNLSVSVIGMCPWNALIKAFYSV